MVDQKIMCKICNKECSALGMASHLKNQHNIKLIDYYNKYCDENEGICKVCGKPTSFRGILYGYAKYCSSKCANLDPEVQEKMRKNSLEKYGTEHPLQSQQIKDKVKKTCIEKYGVSSYMKTDSFREKSIEAIKSQDVIEKRKKTNQEKYGCDMPFQSKEIQEKIKQNNVKKYGVENAYQRDDVKEKIKNTCLSKYGCENGGASKESQEKIKQTRLKKSIEFCKENNCIPLTELNVDYSVKDSIFHSRLLLFNDRYYVKKEDIDEIINHTPQSSGQSVVENNIYNYIKSIYSGTIIKNSRSIIPPKELDIYIPDKKLAIEVDGIWYHSTNNFTPKDYHLSKTLACENQGIRLIHITDWEWDNKQDICKSIINSALGKCSVIYARQCELKEISQYELDNFLILNHLQGTIKATYKAGLFYNNELVQVICLGKSRFNKNEIELLRMCNKLNTNVIGGFSKLMKHQPYNIVISYIDRSKFNGIGYIKTGFSIIKDSGLSYSYYKGPIKLNRIGAQKHKLQTLLGDMYDPEKNEYENMMLNGWLQVYDCGNLKVQYIKN